MGKEAQRLRDQLGLIGEPLDASGAKAKFGRRSGKLSKSESDLRNIAVNKITVDGKRDNYRGVGRQPNLRPGDNLLANGGKIEGRSVYSENFGDDIKKAQPLDPDWLGKEEVISPF